MKFKTSQSLSQNILWVMALLLAMVSVSQAAGLRIHDGYLRYDVDRSQTVSSDLDVRNARYARWMRIQNSQDIRSFSWTSKKSYGEDLHVDFRHSQVELYDRDQWNPELLAHSTTRISLTQRAGATWLHAISNFTQDESQYFAGVAAGPVLITAGGGYGTGFSRFGDNHGNLDPWFFHGGTNARFDYSGATAGLSLSDATSVDVGSWNVYSDGLDKRQSTFIGVAHESGPIALGLRAYNISRGGESIAQGLQLTGNGSLGGISYRQIDHDNGARLRQIGYRFATGNSLSLGFDIEDRQNPLFEASEGSQIVFSIGGQLGGRKSGLLRAQEAASDSDAPTEAERRSRRTRNALLIGAGAVAGAVAISSGSDGQDNAARFPRVVGAARHVATSINPTCVRQNREYGTWLYRNRDSSYSYLPVTRGELASVSFGPPSRVPGGATAVASYHCHGGADPRYVNEEFSPTDIRFSRFYNLDGYLSTPGGAFKFYDVSRDAISRIGNIPVD